jgi:hypothetical protein
MKRSIFLSIILMSTVVISSAQSSITWTTGINVNTSASGNNHPRVVVDRAGNPLVLWNNAGRAMFSRWSGAAFTTPVIVNPTSMNVAGADWMGPDIASHGDTVYVVYKRTPEASDTNHIYCVRSFNGGATFSAAVRVDYVNDSLTRFPTVTTDALGNPIIGYMKFNAAFADARWVVVRSSDFGNTFSVDVKASGWSSPTSTVCDCCPGAITCSGNTVALPYRDNKNNIRDTWAGISTDKGATFPGGMNLDQKNWSISACPASGPDGVVIGDTLYTTFMNGFSGKNLVYYNRSSVSAMTGSAGIPLTGTVTAALSLQNYPRIASDGTALGIVWKQTVSGNDQCLLRFTKNIANGLPAVYDTVDLNNITNADLEISKGNVFVVWQDPGSGTVKYRKGTFSSVTGIQENISVELFSVFPNPAKSVISIESRSNIDEILITNISGQIIYKAKPKEKKVSVNLETAGTYFVTVVSGKETASKSITVVR